MIDTNRCTGRTKRMLLKVVYDSLLPLSKIVVVISHNHMHGRSLMRDVAKILESIDIKHVSNFSELSIRVFSSYIWFGPSYESMIQRARGMNMGVVVHRDNSVIQRKNETQKPAGPENKTVKERFDILGYIRELGLRLPFMHAKKRY